MTLESTIQNLPLFKNSFQKRVSNLDPLLKFFGPVYKRMILSGLYFSIICKVMGFTSRFVEVGSTFQRVEGSTANDGSLRFKRQGRGIRDLQGVMGVSVLQDLIFAGRSNIQVV
jgi:hypothetical protein